MDYKNTNSAVIKSALSRLSKSELINEGIKLKLFLIATQVDDDKKGYRSKLFSIYKFARFLYVSNFLKKR